MVCFAVVDGEEEYGANPTCRKGDSPQTKKPKTVPATNHQLTEKDSRNPRRLVGVVLVFILVGDDDLVDRMVMTRLPWVRSSL